MFSLTPIKIDGQAEEEERLYGLHVRQIKID
jgi:hypothetical protein